MNFKVFRGKKLIQIGWYWYFQLCESAYQNYNLDILFESLDNIQGTQTCPSIASREIESVWAVLRKKRSQTSKQKHKYHHIRIVLADDFRLLHNIWFKGYVPILDETFSTKTEQETEYDTDSSFCMSNKGKSILAKILSYIVLNMMLLWYFRLVYWCFSIVGTNMDMDNDIWITPWYRFILCQQPPSYVEVTVSCKILNTWYCYTFSWGLI